MYVAFKVKMNSNTTSNGEKIIEIRNLKYLVAN
jgi:hypothetical protein